MVATAFAHVSDLHIGSSPSADRAAGQLCETLLREHAGPVLITGDVTHRGRREELERFREIFAPLQCTGRLVVVPGNHDRLGDDLRDDFMCGPRVQAERFGALFIVRLDSTGPHNRRWLDGHGEVTPRDVDEVERALRAAPPGTQTVLMLHHHPLQLPHDHAAELFVTLIGWKSARELDTGALLLERIRGLCDILLHGHRHVPAEMRPWPLDVRQLRIFSAGSSTMQRRFRSFRSATLPACWIALRNCHDDETAAPFMTRRSVRDSTPLPGGT
ncbi:MAG TPA: metallophosphoesterase [Myxococcales bacterium]|nr:metallophosphoesterase [Myxococcales bacterium]